LLSIKQFKLTTKELNKIALPLIIQNMAGVVVVAADQAIIGRISPEAFIAVGTVGSLIFLLAGILGYISVQFNITGGKASIKEDGASDLSDEFNAAIFLNIIVGLFFLAVLFLFCRPLFSILYGFDGYMLDIAVSYARIMSVYLLLQLLLFSFGALFKIKKNTKWILYISSFAMILNLLLDFALVIGLGMGVRAAAINNVAAKVVSLAIYIFLCRKEVNISMSRIAIYKAKMMSTLKSSIPLMGQEVLAGSVFTLAITAIIARIGEYHLAAYLILILIISFAMMPVYMYGSAILTLTSQIESTTDKDSYLKLPKVGLIISASIYISVAILFYIFRDLLPSFITSNIDVIEVTSMFLVYITFARLFDVVSTTYKYSLQVVGEAKFILYRTALINLFAVIILVITTMVFNLGLYGVFICLLVNYAMASVVYISKYRSVVRKM